MGLQTAALLGIMLCGTSAVHAEVVAQATATRAARASATRSIPLDQLDPEMREKISAIVSKPTIFRRLPIQVIDCDPNLYSFLLENPEVVVNIWEVMGISKVTLKRTGPDTFSASDGAGTLGNLTFCYSDHDTQVIYAEGSYEGPMFARPLKARCVLVLKSAYRRETNDRFYVTTRLDAFIHIENVGFDLLARSFQPLITKSADYNLAETAAFVSTVSRTAEANTRGMARLAGKLSHVEPEVRQQFATVSAQIARDAQERRNLQVASRETTAVKRRKAAER